MRADDVGLFWEEFEEIKPTKAPINREPVVLKPYKPRAPLVYQLMSDEELLSHKGQTLIFDTECFKNLFLIAFKHPPTGKIVLMQSPFDPAKLWFIMHNYTVVGFNSYKYDMPLVWLAYQNQDLRTLNAASSELINGTWPQRVQQQFDFSIPKTNHIDLIEVCPLHGSLKLYGARLHATRIQDVPWASQYELEDWQIPVTVDYCVNDLDSTELLWNNLTEQLALRSSLSKEYNQDLMSKSDAQIAEAVIGSELKRIKGRWPTRPKVQPGAIHKFKAPLNLQFQSDYMKTVLQTVEAAEFKIDDTGYLICPEKIKKLEVKIGAGTYRMGIGGLHSSEKTVAIKADDQFVIRDRDVASYYPAIVLNCELVPKNLGRDFLTVYRSLVNRRLAAKQAKDMAVSENLKVTVNGTFGKTGSPYSILYAPDVVIQILLGGQLYLLMIIELLEAAGIPVMSANTDGFIMRCPVDKIETMNAVVANWEQATGFVTEESQYKAIYSRDVNAYLAVKLDGKVKGKNIYYDPWRAGSVKDKYWCFQKNPTCQICVEAVERFIVDGIEIRKTIEACQDIKKFVAIKNVTGGAHYDSEYLGKVVRWYYQKEAKGTINYINSNRIVADTDGAYPLMDLPSELPQDIDHDRYVKRAEDMLADMGWTP